MSIVIVVEDGSNVPDANSYLSVEQAREYAAYRGVELSLDDDEVAAQLIVGMDYLEALECNFQGYRTYDDQALAWPRTDVYLNCKLFLSDQIPSQLKGALAQLVIAQFNGIDILPNSSADDFITSAKVGPLNVTFADPSKFNSDLSPNLMAVDKLLAPLYGDCSTPSIGFYTMRV